MLELTTLLVGIIKNHSFTLSRDDEMKKAKKGIKLQVDFDFSAMSIDDVIAKTVGAATIAWQNGNRDNFDQFTDGQHLGTISVVSAGRKGEVDVTLAGKAKYAASSDAERIEMIMTVSGCSLNEATALVESTD